MSDDLIFVSATTVTTLNYLSIQELEKYKKQFQSFWIPFMEQFIPATTIWVAGEKWCNEPCPIISPCDYDYELVAEDTSIKIVNSSFFCPDRGCPKPIKGDAPKVPPKPIEPTSQQSVAATKPPSGGRVAKPQNIVPTKDLGQTSSTLLLATQDDLGIDKTQYLNKFTPTKTVII